MCTCVCVCISCCFLHKRHHVLYTVLNPVFVNQHILGITMLIHRGFPHAFSMVAEDSTGQRYHSPLNNIEHILSGVCAKVSSGQILRCMMGGSKGIAYMILLNIVFIIRIYFLCFIFFQIRFQHFSRAGLWFCSIVVLQLNLSQTFS